MKRAGAFSFLLFPLLISSATCLSAQTVTIQTGSSSLVLTPLSNAGCPVTINAQHGRGDGKTLLLRNGQLPDTGQLLHMTFGNSGPDQVIAVQITVHGTSAKGGVVQAQTDLLSSPNLTNQISKTLNLGVTVSPKEEAQLGLSLRNFTSVQRIDLDSITYADGRIWQASSAQPCRFVPEAVMLVSSR